MFNDYNYNILECLNKSFKREYKLYETKKKT